MCTYTIVEITCAIIHVQYVITHLPASYLWPAPRFDPLYMGACNVQPPLARTQALHSGFCLVALEFFHEIWGTWRFLVVTPVSNL